MNAYSKLVTLILESARQVVFSDSAQQKQLPYLFNICKKPLRDITHFCVGCECSLLSLCTVIHIILHFPFYEAGCLEIIEQVGLAGIVKLPFASKAEVAHTSGRDRQQLVWHSGAGRLHVCPFSPPLEQLSLGNTHATGMQQLAETKPLSQPTSQQHSVLVKQQWLIMTKMTLKWTIQELTRTSP